MTVEAPPRLGGYQLYLPTFEGPLDVLLRLIELHELAITDVSLVAVTDQFLAHFAALGDAPADMLADFAAVAARLIALKSRSLFPAPPEPEEAPELGDLAAQLAAYQAVNAAAEHLRQRERSGQRAFAREAPILEDLPVRERVVSVPLPVLVGAFRRCLARRHSVPVPYRQAPVISLATMTRRLLDRIGFSRVNFRWLLGESPSRTEQIVGFIALLSLIHQQVLDASQQALFDEIEVERVESMDRAADD
jgi:segregation and condensation protein A